MFVGRTERIKVFFQSLETIPQANFHVEYNLKKNIIEIFFLIIFDSVRLQVGTLNVSRYTSMHFLPQFVINNSTLVPNT